MNDLPKLVVDGDPADIIAGNLSSYSFRIYGHLPTVTEPFEEHTADPVVIRPLRAGDKVTLATTWQSETIGAYTGTTPFATATVANISRTVPYTEGTWLVTVTDVEAL